MNVNSSTARLFLKWLVKHILILGNTGKSFRSIQNNGEFVVSYLQVALLNRAMNKHLAENQVAAVRYIVNDVDSAVSFTQANPASTRPSI